MRKYFQFSKLQISSLIGSFLILCMVGHNSYLPQKSDFSYYQSRYNWLNIEIYHTIKYYANNYKIPEKLVYSVIQKESGDYCKNNLTKMLKVKSYAGAIGICQIMPFHVNNYKELYDFKTNIRIGCSYLSKCLNRSNGNIIEACRMYNAGMNSKRWRYKNWNYVIKVCKDYLAFNFKGEMI